MGRQRKAKTRGNQDEVSIETFESSLLDIIISEYIQVATVPSGKVESGIEIHSEANESIRLRALCHYEAGCPQNFADFLRSAVESGYSIKPNITFAWWCRSRLRYSCSTIVAKFVRFIVPHMKEMRVEKLTFPDGKTIQLEDLEIFSLSFKPRKTHSIVLNTLLGSRIEVVEAVTPQPPPLPSVCSHNVLKCRKTGRIIDITLGQFLGTMKPYIFDSDEEFFSHVPGDVFFFCKTAEEAIHQQVARDSSPHLARLSPDAMPVKFTKRVTRSCRAKNEFCWNCKGVASVHSALKKCTNCKKATYCGRECQILHWKSHKGSCVQAKD